MFFFTQFCMKETQWLSSQIIDVGNLRLRFRAFLELCDLLLSFLPGRVLANHLGPASCNIPKSSGCLLLVVFQQQTGDFSINGESPKWLKNGKPSTKMDDLGLGAFIETFIFQSSTLPMAGCQAARAVQPSPGDLDSKNSIRKAPKKRTSIALNLLDTSMTEILQHDVYIITSL